MAINCSKSKNWDSKTCKKSVGEGNFSIILPKFDNSGNKINPRVHKKFIRQMNDNFGGSSTSPNIIGCFESEDLGTTQCEANIKINSVRDFDADPKLFSLNSNERKKQLSKDFRFLRKLGKKATVQFGQESIIVEFDKIEDATFIPGKRINKLNPKKLLKDPFADSF